MKLTLEGLSRALGQQLGGGRFAVFGTSVWYSRLQSWAFYQDSLFWVGVQVLGKE